LGYNTSYEKKNVLAYYCGKNRVHTDLCAQAYYAGCRYHAQALYYHLTVGKYRRNI